MKSILTRKEGAILIKKLNPRQIAEKWKKGYAINVGDRFKNLKEIRYLHCKITGISWFEPREAEGDRNLYEQLEKYQWYYMKDKWEFYKGLDLINKKSKILEIGSGNGYFLKIAKKKNHSVEGLEFNTKSADRIRSQGFTVHELSLKNLKKKFNQTYDVICSYQVLEHVSDPLEFIEDAINLLVPGGRIIFSVPNGEVMNKIDNGNDTLLNQPPHHMSHWNKQVFFALQKILPLKVKSIHYEPLQDYHAEWVINGYLRKKFSFFGKTASRILFNRYSTLPFQWLAKIGLKKYIPGHTLLVELEKNFN